MKRSCENIVLAVVLGTTYVVAGCQQLPRYELTPEQFEQAYSMPRMYWGRYTEYSGVRRWKHWLVVYGWRMKSWAEPIARLVVAVERMPPNFPNKEQSLLLTETNDDSRLLREQAEMAWRRLPLPTGYP